MLLKFNLDGKEYMNYLDNREFDFIEFFEKFKNGVKLIIF